MPLNGNSATSGLVFIVILVLIITIRMFRTFNGMRFSQARTIFYIVFYFAFSGLIVSTSFIEGVPTFYAIPDAVVCLAAGAWSYKFADKRFKFWQTQDGSIYFKGGVIIYLVYIVALVARLTVDYVFVGSAMFSFAPVGTLPQSAILGLIITDLLLTMGIGLLVGRNLRLLVKYQNIKKGIETVPRV
jgi:hypothetical protein